MQALLIPFVLVAGTFSAQAVPLPAPGTVMDKALRARQAFDAGTDALAKGDVALAQKLFGDATLLAPEWGLAYLQLGVASQAVSPDDPKVLEPLERAVQLDDKNPRAHLLLGLAYLRFERAESAVVEITLALSLRPDLRDARFHLAEALAAAGRVKDAIEGYLQVLEGEPNHIGSLSALAELYEQAGDRDRAETTLLAIVKVQPAVPYHRYRLAQFYQRNGDNKKAQQTFAQLQELDPRPARKMRRLR